MCLLRGGGLSGACLQSLSVGPHASTQVTGVILGAAAADQSAAGLVPATSQGASYPSATAG